MKKVITKIGVNLLQFLRDCVYLLLKLVRDWRFDVVVALAVTCGIASYFHSKSQVFYMVICLIDLYLLAILFAAAVRSDAQQGNFDKPKEEVNKERFENFLDWLFPSRMAGLLMIGLFLVMVVVSFGELYQKTDATEFTCPTNEYTHIIDLPRHRTEVGKICHRQNHLSHQPETGALN